MKNFYIAHFDEIEIMVMNCSSLRTVIEDICSLDPSLGSRLIENDLFMYRVNLAIQNGGKCFPKDVNAFAKMTEGTPLGTLLEHLHELNVHFRGVEEHI